MADLNADLNTFSSTDAFYEADERRRYSAELDYGVWWRRLGVVYRVTWVEETGELIAVQLSPARVQALVDPDKAAPFGFAVYGGEPATVYVIGRIAGRDAIERLLDGWAHECGGDDSLLWVLERIREHGAEVPE